jgi:hypothetical protein
MPISTNIDSPTALYALMTTPNLADLAQSYTQTANIDMTGYQPSGSLLPSKSIANGNNVFIGSYDGGGFTITIDTVVNEYKGLFNDITTPAVIRNINLIYNDNMDNVTPPTLGASWGGLVGDMSVSTIENCSVIYNQGLQLIVSDQDFDIGGVCGFMGQNSVITGCRLIINNTIQIEAGILSSIGLLCGFNDNSDITNCSITTSNTTFNISLKVNSDNDSNAGLICGLCGDSFTDLNSAVLNNITVNLNNNGSIILDSINGTNTINKGAICGAILGDSGSPKIQITDCIININNNQTLTGGFSDFFGSIDIPTTTIQNCQFNYTTQYGNSSKTLTISPAPPTNTPLIYTNSYDGSYNLPTGNYYIPNTAASLIIGPQTTSLQSQTSPAGIIINGSLYAVGTSYSSSNPIYIYRISVNGVGSMYFGFDISGAPNVIDTPEECICQVNSCSTNPQTGITADSRITNMREDKTIRVNVDREFARNSVIAPKFNSYSDYMKYLQGALRH